MMGTTRDEAPPRIAERPSSPHIPESLTHQHLLAAIRTELPRFSARDTLRILDIGCGSGGLMAFLQANLDDPAAPGAVEVHGFDIDDFVERRHYSPEDTAARLTARLPGPPWRERVRCVSQTQPWPYPDASFDVAVSNQVVEHVRDLGPFLEQLARVLRPGGLSIHLFPLRQSLFDGHVRMPLVHRVRGFEQRRGLIRLLSRLGTGNRPAGEHLDDYAGRATDYLHTATAYRRFHDFVSGAGRVRLRASYRYTPELYAQKLRTVLGAGRIGSYRRTRRPLLDWLAFTTLRHLSSITLVLEKPAPPDPHRPR